MNRTEATLGTLFNALPVSFDRGGADRVIQDMSEDSRTIGRGGLFIARGGGAFDGRAYIGDAIARGAVAVLHDGTSAVAEGVSSIVASDVAALTPVIAERFFDEPSRKLALLGVTGTNGKTTVATLCRGLITSVGRRCGLMGTVAVHDGERAQPALLTTPPAIDISRTLARMVANDCDAASMEVSSHALAQGRVAGLRFAAACFTNLSGDHLDYHGTMEAYADAKAKLFEMLDDDGAAIVNADDAMAMRMVRQTRARVIRTGIDRRDVDWHATIESLDVGGTRVTLRIDGHAHTLRLPLVGQHNVMNAMQAGALAHVVGVELDSILQALESSTSPPGRLEPIRPDVCADAARSPLVLVDYAHTDDALENVLRAVRPTVPTGGRLWVVFGCGGDRDRSKRPRMAHVACAHGDRIVVTSDNPRTESPDAIVEEIMSGVPASMCESVTTMVDRRCAIVHAITEASVGDVVLIAGKGHEDYQIVGTTKRPFDDRVVAREALALRERDEQGVSA